MRTGVHTCYRGILSCSNISEVCHSLMSGIVLFSEEMMRIQGEMSQDFIQSVIRASSSHV